MPVRSAKRRPSATGSTRGVQAAARARSALQPRFSSSLSAGMTRRSGQWACASERHIPGRTPSRRASLETVDTTARAAWRRRMATGL